MPHYFRLLHDPDRLNLNAVANLLAAVNDGVWHDCSPGTIMVTRVIARDEWEHIYFTVDHRPEGFDVEVIYGTGPIEVYERKPFDSIADAEFVIPDISLDIPDRIENEQGLYDSAELD